MNTRALYLFASIAGPILLVIGLASIFGVGIPDFFGSFVLLVGACLCLFSQRQAKHLHEEGISTGFVPMSPNQKKQRFWMVLVIAVLAFAATWYFVFGK